MSEKPASLTTPPQKKRIRRLAEGPERPYPLAVNRELILLYWEIGRDILARQAEQDWGSKVIERLSHALKPDAGTLPRQ